MKQFIIHTFGCQMNVHDSDKMAGMLAGLGYVCAERDADADIILFNTCTVRDHAHHKAISEIGRVIKLKKRKPDLIVGVCGCVAQEERGRLFEIYPQLDLVFGPDQIARLPELLKEKRIAATDLIDDPNEYNWLSEIKSPHPPFKKGGAGGISRFLTIMKGCNNKCSFCIVPSVRGAEVSRSADDIVAEIEALAEQGVKEVTLLGQNVNSYRADFVQLLQRISSETDILRIRYTSPHPKDLDDDLIEEHASNPKLCRHMHLPLQAGSDKVLRDMKRSYNKKQFIEKAMRLREKASGIDITTDIIVGFPGETEADFQDTLDVVKEVAFDGMFAFKYSPRPGTVAAELPDSVPQVEKEERLRRLLALNAEIWKEKAERLVGTKQQVLVEGASKRSVIASPKGEAIPRIKFDKGDCFGAFAPRNDNGSVQLTGRTFANKIVNFAGNLNLVGHIVPVVITRAGANSLGGEICS